VPVGATGELHLSGAGLARGYLGRPELTAEKFIPNPFSSTPGDRLYKTGDIARYLPDGQVDYLGRRDNQIKLRGFRIELGEIEEALCKHEKVRAAAVVARDNVTGEKQLVAYVVDREGVESNAAEVRNYLRERLPEHMIPAAVVRLDALPLTSNGKLDRRALPAPERDDVESRKSYVAPRNTVESELVKIWEDIIGVTPLGVADNFFEVGGHSLSAIRLMARIETHFGRKLPLSILVQSGTIESMAQVLSNELTPHTTPLVTIQPAGSKRPVFFVHPSGGGVLCYVALSNHLGVERPFYGLQDPVLDGGDQPYDSIPQMAADYVKAVRAVQEDGPYLIGGYSFGGLIAFEMAQQLRSEGQEIAALLVIDSMSPANAKHIHDLEAGLGVDDSMILFQDAREQAQQLGKQFNVSADQLRNLTLEERLLVLFEEVKRARLMPPEFGLADVRRYLRMHRGRRTAIRSYTAQPYPDHITLFRTNEPPRHTLDELAELLDPAKLEQYYAEESRLFRQTHYGWDKVSTKPIKAYSAAGGHLTMLSDPYVQQLGRELALYLDTTEHSHKKAHKA
jgi:thioesterase domain-containing protein